MKKEFPDYHPYPRDRQGEINLHIRHILIAEALAQDYCNLFRGLSEEQLVSLAQSFRFDNCVKRERLENILTRRER